MPRNPDRDKMKYKISPHFIWEKDKYTPIQVSYLKLNWKFGYLQDWGGDEF